MGQRSRAVDADGRQPWALVAVQSSARSPGRIPKLLDASQGGNPGTIAPEEERRATVIAKGGKVDRRPGCTAGPCSERLDLAGKLDMALGRHLDHRRE